MTTVQGILARLLELRTTKQSHANITKADIEFLLRTAAPVIKADPMLVNTRAPIFVVTDVHGQFEDLLRIFATGGEPPASRYIFLGDYVDRGKNSIECAMLCLCYKVLYPKDFFMLRGNHEAIRVNSVYGFLTECRVRFDLSVFNMFNDLFSYLPIAGVIGGKIFCCHGGISPEMTYLYQINSIKRPVMDIGNNGLICDILWSDPADEDDGDDLFAKNRNRGVGCYYGKTALANFFRANNLEMIARGHEVVEEGYKFIFDRKCVTIFSAPNYGNEYDNAGAFMEVKANLQCSFHVLQPVKRPYPKPIVRGII